MPILPDFHKSEVHHILRNSGAKIAFVSSKQAHKVDEPNLGDIQMVVSLDDTEISSQNYEKTTISNLVEGTVPKNLEKEIKESILKRKTILATDIALRYDIRVSTIKLLLKQYEEEGLIKLLDPTLKLKIYVPS